MNGHENAQAEAGGAAAMDGGALAGWQRPAGWAWHHEMWIQVRATGIKHSVSDVREQR